jgi:hypothetical protein
MLDPENGHELRLSVRKESLREQVSESDQVFPHFTYEHIGGHLLDEFDVSISHPAVHPPERPVQDFTLWCRIRIRDIFQIMTDFIERVTQAAREMPVEEYLIHHISGMLSTAVCL